MRYEDFEKKARQMGLFEQFSEYDLDLARTQPSVGLSLLNYKNDYRNAKTPEARAMANAGAERIRNEYGNYTAGGSGSGYYLQAPRPISFSSGEKPTYKSNYSDRIENALRGLENHKPFEYNADTDDLYAQYRKQYTREGNRALADTLGTVSAASGGMPSSFAVTAASQARDYHASKMTDKIPELYQAAYNRHLNEYKQKADTLGALQRAEQTEYSKYLNDLNQYNNDRGFEYNKYMADISHQQAEQDRIRKQAFENAQMGDYRALKDNGVNTDNNPMEFEKALKMAQIKASVGDFSGYKALGIDTSNAGAYLMPRSSGRVGRGSSGQGASISQLMSLAKLKAEYGDFSGLRELGIDTSAFDGSEERMAQERESQAGAILKQAFEQNRGIVENEEDIAFLLSVYDEQTLRDLGVQLIPNYSQMVENVGKRDTDTYIKNIKNTFNNLMSGTGELPRVPFGPMKRK